MFSLIFAALASVEVVGVILTSVVLTACTKVDDKLGLGAGRIGAPAWGVVVVVVAVGPETLRIVVRDEEVVMVVGGAGALVVVVVEPGVTVVVVDDGVAVVDDALTAAGWVVPVPQALRLAAAVPISSVTPASARSDAIASRTRDREHG